MSMTVLGLVLTWLTTVSMRDLDRQRDASVQALALNNLMLETAVFDRTQEVVARQSFLDALPETVDVGILSCDARGTTLVRNRAQRTMSGLNDAAPGAVAAGSEAAHDFLELDGTPLEAGQYPLPRALRGEDVVGVELLLGPAGGPTGRSSFEVTGSPVRKPRSWGRWCP